MRSIRVRLLAGYGLLVVLLAFSLLSAIEGIETIHAHQRDAATRATPYLTSLGAAALAAKAAANDERGYLLTGDEKFVTEFRQRLRVVETSLATAYVGAMEAEDRDYVTELRAGVGAWAEAVTREFALYRSDRTASLAMALGPNRDARKAYEARFGAAEAEAQWDLRKSVQAADRAAHWTMREQLVLFLVSLIVALVVAAVVVSHQRDLLRQSRLSQHLALHDALTGLPNRVLFADRLGQALAASRRTGRGTAVVLIDLDRFKEVNDTLGHHYGDLLLREVGPRVEAMLRESDTLARLSGDEFAVLLTDVDTTQVHAVAERILAALHASFTLADVTVDLEASIGVALAPAAGDTIEDLMRHADIAMYSAKETHAGVVVYDPDRSVHAPGRLQLLGELRRALDRPGELVLHYQPKVDLSGERLCGVEALLRWQHPERGLVPPGEFIPAAENTGLINRLTTHVLTLAVQQARTWLAQGMYVPIAVNLSARCLLDTTLPERVARLLAEHEVPAELLRLEVTESAVMGDAARSLSVLNSLHGLGTRLSIDDFGTGYSSMAYLKRLPVDELKIDRSFIMDMTTDDGDAVIVRGAVDLGHNLGLTVVAEGVETEGHVEVLTELGCDIAQGYHYARPMPPEQLTTWLAGRTLPTPPPVDHSAPAPR